MEVKVQVAEIFIRISGMLDHTGLVGCSMVHRLRHEVRVESGW